MYKKSFYNIEVEGKDINEYLVFNSFTGALVSLNESVSTILDNIENVEVDKLSKTEQNYINSLKNKGFIVEKDIDEVKLLNTLQKIDRYSSKNLSLTIVPSLLCNMNCPYCYESKENKRMSEETISNLISFIEDKSKYIDTLDISWFGGEPLLEKDLIYRLSAIFKEICKKRNVKYISTIVTNGILLDRDTAIRLREDCNVQFAQITIDGLKEINDKRRHLKNDQSSFDIIVKNIDSIKDFFNVFVRVNVDKKNIEDAYKLVEYFVKEKQWTENVKFYFSPVTLEIGNNCSYNSNDCLSNQEFQQLSLELLKITSEISSIKSSLNSLVRPILHKCAAICNNHFIIDPAGDLYKCSGDVNQPEKKVGTLLDYKMLNNEAIKWLNIDNPEKCNECKIRPQCQSGCPSQRLNNNNTPICKYDSISNLKEILKLYYEESNK